MSGWAVVDVETTGLNAARDRIVEIAVVRLDPEGRPLDEWSTLVNPEGSGPGRFHGLLAGDLASAPRFRDIADDLLGRLSDRVIVAHNAPFDVSFLQAETVRAGIAWGPIEGFCTMEVLYGLGVAKRRDLHACCADVGVAVGKEHVAIDDARAVAGLMRYLGPRLWTIATPRSAPTWPEPRDPLAIENRATPPIDRTAATKALQQQVRVPRDLGITEAAGATYLGLLDMVVDDGVVTDNEVEALSLFAKACGITREIARKLNQAYLDGISRATEEDGVVTEDEREEWVRPASQPNSALELRAWPRPPRPPNRSLRTSRCSWSTTFCRRP